ncbi:MAG: hypothetical protein JSW43_07665 [Gemmatimonadota bacterium]|nr:MAG: hypothetical protein JSW43_07665 [Gemmatimonadota bacterium]
MTRIVIACGLLALTASAARAQFDPSLLWGMQPRSIGPAGMSGRVASIDAVAADPRTIYVGSATGGVWKSKDGGLTWTPVFDEQATSSIGAVAVFQPNPDIVWVGTGEGNPRNSAGVGRGIYKSVDGGRTWSHLGLEGSERIHRVVLHPTNPDVAYLAAMGPTWADGEERGVYKTQDGGQTWQRVLYVDQRTGAADLVMDPSNPNKLFAAMWEHRRWPWFFESGGPGSGLFVTYDGGDRWTRLTAADGLPPGELGRIGLAVAHNDPNVVYALVEAERSVLLRSDDGGHRWRTVNDEPGIAPRPFYYADIRVDPQNENRLYSIHGRCTVSEDAGKTFRTVVQSGIIHGDVHELWIHPSDSRVLIMGNDGGVGISYDRGEHWRFVENLPLAQFYHVNVDLDTPYNVYGGLQDNGSWFGPSSVWRDDGIRNYYWTRVGGGDGFGAMVDFGDTRYGYSMSQQGNLRRFDKVTGERKDIQPVHPQGTALRFHWNAAINVDPFDSTVVYFGSQFVHRTRDGGTTWEIISPDLTTNDPEKQRADESGGLTRDATGAENHTTIITIAPSPVERGVIWVGTDDGNVQLTRNGGAEWTNVVGRMRGVPANTWVPHIEPSKFDAGTAFAVFDDHRRGNWTTYVYRTTDYGRSWQSLATDEIDGFVHVIEQDPEVADLLYLGTEFGLFVSLNGGESWFKWTEGMPTVPVRALIVHPRDDDLVIGTHGRGAYVLDDVRPLRALAQHPGTATSSLHLFDPPTVIHYHPSDALGYRSTGHAMFSARNRPHGALLSYWVGGDEPATSDIQILDSDGTVIRSMKGPVRPGLNRAVWDLTRTGPIVPAATGTETLSGPAVLPGTYAVRIIVGGAQASGSVEVLPDPRMTVARRDREAKFAMQMRAQDQLEVVTEVMNRLRDTEAAIDLVLERSTTLDDSTAQALGRAGTALKQRLDGVSRMFVEPSGRQGIFARGQTVFSELRSVMSSLGSSRDALTDAQRIRLARAEATLDAGLAELNRVFAEDVAALRAQARAADLPRIPEYEELSIERGPIR